MNERATRWRILDAPNLAPSSQIVHVAHDVTVNDVSISQHLHPEHPVLVATDTGNSDYPKATVLALVVHQDALTFAEYPTGTAVNQIAGIPVFTPHPDETAYRWHRLPEDSQWVQVYVLPSHVEFGHPEQRATIVVDADNCGCSPLGQPQASDACGIIGDHLPPEKPHCARGCAVVETQGWTPAAGCPAHDVDKGADDA